MKVLYYPYSRCFDDVTLKKLFLLFDKTYFVDSKPIFIRELITKNNFSGNDIEYYNRLYNIARSAGIIDYFDPTEILRKYDGVICANVRSDIENPTYLEQALEYSYCSLSVFTERLPPSYTLWFDAGVGFYGEAISLQKFIHYNGDGRLLSEQDLYDLNWPQGVRLRSPIVTKESALEIIKKEYAYAIGGNPAISLPSYELPFLQLSALRINEAMLICLENNFAMITDELVYNELLQIKAKSVANQQNNNALHTNKVSHRFQLNTLKLRIAEEILNCIFERTDFLQLSVEEIIHFRSKNQSLFVKLWNKIDQIATKTNTDASDSDIFKQVYNQYTNDIQMLKNELSSTFLSVFSKVLIQSAGVIVPTAIASSSLEISFSKMLLTCATAQLAYISTTGAEQVVNGIKGIKTSKNDPYAYLIKASKSDSKKTSKVKQKSFNNIVYEGYIVLAELEVAPHLGFGQYNYLALLSFYNKIRQFYVINSRDLILPNYTDAKSLLKQCKKVAMIKPFTAPSLYDALVIIKDRLPYIKFDPKLMSKYNFLHSPTLDHSIKSMNFPQT